VLKFTTSWFVEGSSSLGRSVSIPFFGIYHRQNLVSLVNPSNLVKNHIVSPFYNHIECIKSALPIIVTQSGTERGGGGRIKFMKQKWQGKVCFSTKTLLCTKKTIKECPVPLA
jgi:hypothetical protein